MGYVEECYIRELKLEDALALVPVEYAKAYRWFQEMEGEYIRCLPMGDNKPDGFDFPLARQSGIFTPSYSNFRSHGRTRDDKPAKRYVLSIHSEGQKWYDDKDVIYRQDGTWIFDYRAQAPKGDPRRAQSYNEDLMNCLRDGVPVGVMVKGSNGYKILGLAYVEKYNSAMKMFTLHGPVNIETEDAGAFVEEEGSLYTLDESDELLHWTDLDERKVATYERVVREGQEKFREDVMAAYDGACALTGVTIPEVLQAAHIDPYRGRHTQIVSNGILLRSDIHLLYDAQLLGIAPESHIIELSDKLIGSPYERLAREIAGKGSRRLRIPQDPRLAPREELLSSHYKEFLAANS